MKYRNLGSVHVGKLKHFANCLYMSTTTEKRNQWTLELLYYVDGILGDVEQRKRLPDTPSVVTEETKKEASQMLDKILSKKS